MSLPFFRYQPDEWRILRLLGGFSFLMLAGLTTIGIAAESLFVAELGAAKMAFGIIAGQALVIPIFRLYGWLRSKLRAQIIAPVVIVTLVIGLSLIFLWERHMSVAAKIALFVFIPSLAGLLGSEYGRLSAGLMNPRLARRLFPSIGSIGGLGATLGAFISGFVAIRYSSQWLVLVGSGLVLATLLPAWLAARQQRPSPRRHGLVKTRLLGHRYALLIVLCVATIAAITTLLRFQLGAAALETHGEDGLGVFYSQLSFIINVSSVAFTLVLTRLTISQLGAANSLLLYPGILLIVLGGAIFLPSLLVIAAAASSERLFRQNIHRTVISLVKMPLHVALRTRIALVSSGTARPLGTIIASVAILLLTGEIGLLPWTLDWQAFTAITLSLAAITAFCLIYVRNRYVKELVGSLHARRLQLDTEESTLIAMDPDVKRMLLGYLRSDLEERCALALALLADHVDDDVIDTIRQRWSNWSDAIRTQAMQAIAEGRQEFHEVLSQLAANDASDVVQAIATRVIATDWDDDALRGGIESSEGQTRAELVIAYVERHGAASMLDLMTELTASTNDDERRVAAAVIAGIDESTYDHLIPKLVSALPKPLLEVIARRPDPRMAGLVLSWIAGDDTASAARGALLAMRGESVVDTLLAGCEEPRLAAGAIDVLLARAEPQARQGVLRLLQHQDIGLRLRVLNALAVAGDETVDDGKGAIRSALDNAVDEATAWQGRTADDDSLRRTLAENELQYALEVIFAALDALHAEIPFRRLYLATQSHDSRQRALAAETLDEYLPRAYKRKVLALLEPELRRGDNVPDWAGNPWLDVLAATDDPVASRVRAMLACSLFAGWRFEDLLTLAKAQTEQAAALCIRNGEAIDVEELLLTGKSPAPGEGDVCVPLSAIYSVIADNPRCGGLWLRGLAERIPESETARHEVTRSEFMSLATRTLNDDQEEAAGDMEIWQRVFFLRTMAMTQALPAGRLRLLAEIARTLSAEPGDVIINEGRLGNHFYMVCSGKLDVSAKQSPVATLGPSDAFGGMSLMRGARRSFSVVASEQSELLTIDRVDFLDLIDAHPSLVRSFARTLALRIKAARESQQMDSAQQPA